MEPNTPQKHIQESVTEAIRSGKVSMRSSFHFLLKSIVVVAALLCVFVLSTIILNFILFSIHIQSHHELLGFGLLGILAFIGHFPWMLFCIDIALVVLVIHLFRSFRWGYKTPILYVGFGIVFLVILLGVYVERMNHVLNKKVMYRSEEGGMHMPVRSIDAIRIPPAAMRSVCRCEILEIRNEGLLVARDVRSGVVRTFVLSTPSAYATTTGLLPGAVVMIAGHFDGDGDEDDVVEVFGIRKPRME